MRRTVLALSCLSLGLLAGCTTGTSAGPETTAPSHSGGVSPAPMSLSLLVFNIEYGGSPSTDDVMADLDADVVGVLESYNRLPQIAARAGYPYYDVGLQIMSKYPILEPAGADGLYAYLEVRPGEAVAMINTHLDYVQDGPNRLGRGVPVERVLQTEEEVRLSSIQTLLPSATALLDEGWPVLFTGDLNEPSHLDWTSETAGSHGGVGPVDWPVSIALTGAGLRDAFREKHPDPLSEPGNTWGGVAGSSGSPRRIDYAYVGGPIEVQSSEVVGEQGGDGVALGYPDWTSDHRAVLSRLRVSPAPIPTTVALSSRLITPGDDLTAIFRMPEGAADGGTLTLTGPTPSTYPLVSSSGTVQIPTRALAGGDYRVVLSDATGVVLSTNDLYVRPPQAHVELSTDAPTYAVGAPITVRWTTGPANRWDWIGVYRAGASDPARDDYLVWGYTGGHDAGALPPTAAGELVLGRDHQGAPWPLPRGRYRVHYLLTDQYESAGYADFEVR